MRRGSFFKRLLLSLVIVIVFAAVAVGIGISRIQSPAKDSALSYMESDDEVTVEDLGKQKYLFTGKDPQKGLVFYTGAGVDYRAYAPLMCRFAKEDILCVVISSPFEFAILNMNGADGVKEQFPEIKSWYIGGHSLGGSVAAMYLGDHPYTFDGLLLLASYTTMDLTDKVAGAVSIYGDQDGVLSMERYEKNKSLLPQQTEELVIAGGNHAQFGDYGPQRKDHPATISMEEQMEQTVQFFVNCVKEG